MKLIKCDSCGKVFRENETNVLTFKEHGGAEVFVKVKDGSYSNTCDLERDLCRECSIKVLQILCPKWVFLPIEEYNMEGKS